MSTIEQLLAMRQEIHQINVQNLFWEKGKDENKGERAMLIITELAEAVEAHRKSHLCEYLCGDAEFSPEWFEMWVKDTVEDEMADTVIRTLDYITGFGIEPIAYHGMQTKLKYGNNFGEDILVLNGLVIDAIRQPVGGSSEHDHWIYFLFNLMSFCEHYKIDILQHVRWKLQYNKTWPAKHNKAY